MRENTPTHQDRPMHSKGQAPSNLASEAIDIPTAVEVIAGMNAKSRDNALEAAEQRYGEVACVGAAMRLRVPG
jgi:hypothetical protein